MVARDACTTHNVSPYGEGFGIIEKFQQVYDRSRGNP